jgi:hypothetical protein
MSQWMQVRTEIKDLGIFLETCENCDVAAEKSSETHYNLRDRQSSGRADLTKDGDIWNLGYDQDAGYSPFAKRFGRNGGTLVREYTRRVVLQETRNQGMMILSEEERSDGSIRLCVGY